MTSKDIKSWFIAERHKDTEAIGSIITNKPLIGYVGWNGYGNLGDEAVWEGARALFPQIKTFRISRPVLMTEKLMRRQVPLRAFYLGGGTLINQSTEWLMYAEYAKSRSIPSFCMGSGVAESKFWQEHSQNSHNNNLERWAKVLHDFEFVGIRGPRSKAILKEAGIDAEIVGDAAFSIAPSAYQKRRTGKVLGLNISYGTSDVMWGNPEEFRQVIATFIQAMIKDGYEVRVLPIWHEDLPISQDVVNAVASDSCKLIKAHDTVDEYIKQVELCDIFMGEKLHATIFSAMYRIPSIMLAYRPKCFDFMESIDMDRYVVRTDQLQPEKLQELCNDLIENYDNISTTLDERTRYYKNIQQTHAAKLSKTLGIS